jgi:DNA ligase (NAD+)
MRHVGETTARRWRAAMVVEGVSRRRPRWPPATPRRAEMDNLDQIGDTVIDSLAAYFGEAHNRGIVEELPGR